MAKKRNLDIRAEAKANGVCLYEIANKLGVRQTEFSVELRYELPEERKAEIRSAIREVRKESESE